MKKILFITPPYHCGVVESAGKWPNLGFVYLAGEVRLSGYEPMIYDAMSKWDDYPAIEARIQLEKPDVVCSTAFTSSINDAIKVLALAKSINPEIVTIIGGVHPTFCYEEVLTGNRDAVDFCVLREGELTTPELLTTIFENKDLEQVKGIAFIRDGQVIKTGERSFIDDLDSLHPAWDLVNWDDYPLYFIDDSKVAILNSSRGCIHSCAFCSQHKFWQGTYRQRDAVKFTDEIEHLSKSYGVNVFFIADEYPTRDRQRWEKILEILIEKQLGVHLLIETCVHDIIRDKDIMWKYRKAGILFIYMGVEGTNQKRLDLFKKDIRFSESKEAIKIINDAGMITESSVILGTPDETKESIAETFELAKEYGPDFMHFLMLAPWPYADMYEELKPHIEEWDFSKYNLVAPVIKPKNMTRDELFQEVLNCYKKYYMNKLPQWHVMKGNDLKRSCLLNGMQAIMKNSFLKDHMKGLGKMPKIIEEYVKQ